MTVQAGIETETDLELLVGEMPAVPCEHPDHAKDPEAHGGDATHYAQGHCINPKCSFVGRLLPMCQPFINWAMTHDLYCPVCHSADPGVQVLRVVAPINSSTR